MARPPERRPATPWEKAEAAFKKATTKSADPAPKTVVLPGVKEAVSLRIDQDVLEHFRAAGPGWQDRINAVLRKAAFG